MTSALKDSHCLTARGEKAGTLVIPNKFADYTLSMNYLIPARSLIGLVSDLWSFTEETVRDRSP